MPAVEPMDDPSIVNRPTRRTASVAVDRPATCPVTGASAPDDMVLDAAIAGSGTDGDRPAVAEIRALRWTYMASGLACVGMGSVGVVVPGLPTTVFLIIAMWCFARSCPVLEHWLLEHRVLGPYVRAVVEERSMPRSAKVVSLALMWAAVTTSVLLLGFEGRAALISASVMLLAVVGSGFICFWMKTTRTADAG